MSFWTKSDNYRPLVFESILRNYQIGPKITQLIRPTFNKILEPLQSIKSNDSQGLKVDLNKKMKINKLKYQQEESNK